MSVIAIKDGSYELLTKGADSSILPRTTLSPEEALRAQQTVSALARRGLRTLVFASRELKLAPKIHHNRIG